MWTVASPWVLAVAGLGAISVVALHLLSVHRPPELLLPTTRFVPETTARAVARQRTPTDRWLLVLRVLALLAAGAALAGLRWAPASARDVALIIADRRLITDSAALRTHVTTTLVARGAGGTRATRDANRTAEAIRETEFIWTTGLQEPGRALPLAVERAARLMATRAGIERFALHVVVPATLRDAESWQAWRAAWPGAVQLLPEPGIRWPDSLAGGTGGERESGVLPVRVIGAPAADLLAEVLSRGPMRTDRALIGARAGDPDTVVVQRDSAVAASAAVATWAVVVQWPLNGRPAGWPSRATPDTVGSVSAGGRALLAPFVRTARAPALQRSEHAIAWWGDGEIAAIERATTAGCVRTVAVVLPAASDVLLTPAADGLLHAVRAPCGGRVMTWRLADSLMTADMVDRLAPASVFMTAAAAQRSPAVRWLQPALLTLALLALGAEWWWRRAARA